MLKEMIRFITFTAFSLVVLSPFVHAIESQPQDMTFQQGGIKFNYPNNWKRAQVKDTLVTLLSPKQDSKDNFQENVNVSTQRTNDSLENFTKTNISQVDKMMPGSTVLENKEVSLGGLPGHLIVYSGTQNNQNLKFRQAWTLYDGKAFVFSYAAAQEDYDKYLPDVEKMTSSVEFT